MREGRKATVLYTGAGSTGRLGGSIHRDTVCCAASCYKPLGRTTHEREGLQGSGEEEKKLKVTTSEGKEGKEKGGNDNERKCKEVKRG